MALNNTQTFKVKGMKTDLSESSFDNSFAYENKNVRINVVDEDNTLMNLTNERGTKFVGNVKGIPIGLKKFAYNKALLFTTENEGSFEPKKLTTNKAIDDITLQETTSDIDISFKDHIYKLEQYNKEVKIEEIGTLIKDTNFSACSPLEVETYKDGDKDYFYIADGINNFKSFCLQGNEVDTNKDIIDNQNVLHLDYNCKIGGSESITANQSKSSDAEFYSGVIVYCFSYVTYQGHKTGIIDITPKVLPIKNFEQDYGLEPNKKANIAFDITINGLVNTFKEIEVYSLFRSTLNGEIVVRKVCKMNITQSVMNVTDLNQGEIISYQELLTRFNSVLVPSTITQKSGSLFLGNIKTNNYDDLKKYLLINTENNPITLTQMDWVGLTNNNQYFYGLQFQDIYGNWSPVIYCGSSNEIYKISIPAEYQVYAIQLGYVAVRAMILDNKRIRNTICEGITAKTWKLENGKYGVDYYSPYFLDISKADIYHDKESIVKQIFRKILNKSKEDSTYRITPDISNVVDFYSPDIEFDENFSYNTSSKYRIFSKKFSEQLVSHKYDIAINGNIGILYNNNSTELGKFNTFYDSDDKGYKYLWTDAIVGYQKALQILVHDNNGSYNNGDSGTDVVSTLYAIGRAGLKEKPTDYVIYLWQPSGSLNDSDGKSSVLKYKRISRKYCIEHYQYSNYSNNYEEVNIKLFDGTTNNLPIKTKENNSTVIKVYSGTVNQKIYPGVWSINEDLRNSNIASGETFWDDEQAALGDEYALSILNTYHFVGQPIEFYYALPCENINIIKTQEFSALAKMLKENSSIINKNNLCPRVFAGTFGTGLGDWNLNTILGDYDIDSVLDSNYKYKNDLSGEHFSWAIEKAGYEYGYSANGSGDGNGDGSGILTGSFAGNRRKNEFSHICTAKIRVTNKYNRNGNINIAYKTARHLVLYKNNDINGQYCQIRQSEIKNYNITQKDIETGQWIVCSKKAQLKSTSSLDLYVDINDAYIWDSYECLKTEPYSLSDENQVTCVLDIKNIYSYINPICRYDNIRGLSDYNGITSAVFNKMNMVYNQKNNFFIFSGITENTITDDSLENTILYSDMKLNNETEDSFVNFNTTNFYTIDSNINKINKLITYNDKLLCFSDNAISQILYNENVVVNTDSVQSLGLASTDKVTGSQLLSNTYGCLNKWSIGIYNNILFFNDDLNNKMIAYSGEFAYLNESLSIETLNSKLLKKSVWNPVYWDNTKLNIDSYAKDVHYTAKDIDIAMNQTIGSFTSLYSYERIPYIETLGDFTIAIRNLNRKSSEVYLLRQGDYNHFFGKFEPYWTTVIVNQNSLVNKMLSNIEFSTEAYDYNMLPIHDFTFDHIEFWNDYQSNKMAVNYKLYGQSLLKKKFRVWRINMFRNSTKMLKRNYDIMSNTWHYLKLSSENENNNKLTLHWLNVNYF